jgi:CHAT domain-containing protein/tetratricopeptide (TPR) repeat protein
MNLSAPERTDSAEDAQDSGRAERPRKNERAKKKRAASGRPVLFFAGLGILGVLLLAGAVIFAVVKVTAKPTTPQWQRQLTKEDAKKAANLTGQIHQLVAAGKLAEALVAAEQHAQLREERQGADHWQAVNARWEVNAIQRVERQDEASRSDYSAVLALARQGKALEVKGDFREAKPVLQKVLAIRRKVLGEDHPDTANAYYFAAMNLRCLDKFMESEAAYRKSLAICRKVLGEDHPQTALSYEGVAYVVKSQGKYAEAEEGFDKALALFRKILGEADPYTARGYRNIAENLEIQGKYAEAEVGLHKALDMFRKAMGEEHPETARCYNDIAVNLSDQGKYALAEETYRKVLAIRRKALGEEHPDTAASYDNVASDVAAQGKYAEAEADFRKALAIRRKIWGEERTGTAASYNNLGLNLNGQGKYTEAEECFRKALAIRRKVLGEEHAATAASYNNVALNLNAQGKLAEAEAGYRKALAITRTVMGEEHRQTAVCFNNVAFNLNCQGKYAEAEQGLSKSLEIFRKVLGEEHPQTARSYNSVAGNLSAQGKNAKAEEKFRKALPILRKTLGEEHPYTARTYNDLALCLNAQGKYAEAEEGYRKALAIYRTVLGEEHPNTAECYSNWARNLGAQGKYAEAEEGLRKVLAIRQKVLGEEHRFTAASYNNVAMILNAQGKYAEAEQFWTVAVDRFSKAREDFAASGLDRATLTAERSPLPSLAAVLARNGKPEAAWRRFEESLGRGTLEDLSARLRRPVALQVKEEGLIARLRRLDKLIENDASVNATKKAPPKRREDLLTERRQAQDELDEFDRYLEKTYGRSAGAAFGLHEIQAALPADAALVGWLDRLPGGPKAAEPGGGHWTFLLRSQGDPVVVRSHGTGPKDGWSDADRKLPAELRTVLQTQRGDWQPLAERLRKQRLDPLASYLAAGGDLPAVKQLIVLPSAALAGVPVEAFAEGYTVSYALSGTLYARQRHQPELTSYGLLALADPVFERPRVELASRRGLDDGLSRSDDGAWLPLPGTRIEAGALRQLFRGQASVLSDSLASEQKLYDLAQSGDLGKYRYLHFATHGTADERFPLRSALILSRDNLPDPGKQLDAGLPVFDGQLTAEEVLRQWHLNAELVTLSACQTALGKYERGEGFVGFAQALILAGSRAVCLSLWKVDDTATALLMSRFYANMLGKREGLAHPMKKAAALAEAKSWLRGLSRDQAVERTDQLGGGAARGKGRPARPVLPDAAKVPGERARETDKDRPYAHPYFWGAFVLIGDPD